jgi:hypothetical protein
LRAANVALGAALLEVTEEVNADIELDHQLSHGYSSPTGTRRFLLIEQEFAGLGRLVGLTDPHGARLHWLEA